MRIIYDFAINFILLISLYWMYVIVRSFFYNKKYNIKTNIDRVIILFLFAVCFIAVFTGSYIIPKIPNVKEINLGFNTTQKTEKIKIVFLSDFHAGPYKKYFFFKKVAKQIDKLRPDLIILGGDYIFTKEKEAIYLAPFKSLAPKYPIVAVTGNHEFNESNYNDPRAKDKTKLLRRLFGEWGVKILDNENITINTPQGTFSVAGIPDLWTSKADFFKAEANINPRLVKIIVSHNPDVILNPYSRNYNLILSGHTHAGQIRLPYVGSVPPIPNELGRKYDYGLFDIGEKSKLYITSGIGETGARTRFFSRSEIAVINIDL